MGKQGFLGDIFKSLDQMEQEVCTLCGCLQKPPPCKAEQNNCPHHHRPPCQKPPEARPPCHCQDTSWRCPPSDFRPPCGRKQCCCQQQFD